jgi:hypothetical protein
MHEILKTFEYLHVKCCFCEMARPEAARIREMRQYTFLDPGFKIWNVSIPKVGGVQAADVESEVIFHGIEARQSEIPTFTLPFDNKFRRAFVLIEQEVDE